jgi:DNA repair protein RecN (Recombination protein N)
MLVRLHVRNLALIAEEEVTFTDGLNILTGETGAGKSIIIGSVNLALGEKADRTIIRSGEEYALIELVFTTDDAKQSEKLREMDLPVEEDGMILIKRKIRADGSACSVNGETVTLRQLREIAALFIDIYGQRENQTILKRDRQLGILDEYAGDAALSLRADVKAHAAALRELRGEWEDGDLNEEERKRETELLDFEIGELEDAAVKKGEDEELEAKYRKMSSAGKLSAAIAAASEYTDGEDGAAEQISRACRELSMVSGNDAELDGIAAQLTEIDSLLSDFGRSVSDYAESLQFDAGEFSEVEERLNLINHLKDKYGNSVEELDRAFATRQKKREELLDYEVSRKALQGRLEKEEKQYLGLCRRLSAVRRKAADEFSEGMRRQLPELNFEQSVFQIDLVSDEKQADSTGMDKAVFLISMNAGEEPRPMDMIASGGELSRIMLAMKTVFAGKDDIHTFIFDEIDTGISGQTAWKVSEKLGRLAKKRQIICITHLPQIAAMEDTHFLISKNSADGRTFTHIARLDEADSDREISRLLGGMTITDAAVANAREMKQMAAASKKNADNKR